MDEKEKRKPKNTPSSALTPEDASTFFYEVPVSLEQMVYTMSQFEQMKDMMKMMNKMPMAKLAGLGKR